MYRISSEEQNALMSTCSWCKKVAYLYDTTFIMWVKIRQKIYLGDWDSKLIKLSLNNKNKLHAIAIAGTNLNDKKYAYELMFMTCSKECSTALSDALKKYIESSGVKKLGNE